MVNLVTAGLGLAGGLAGGLMGGSKKSRGERMAESLYVNRGRLARKILQDNKYMPQDMTDLQRQAFDMAGGFGDISPALNYFNSVLSGGYENPYAQKMFDQASSAVRQKLDSQFANAGRLGSDAHANVMADAYGDLATQIYGGERQYIDAAARALPSAYGMGLQSASAMAGLGEQQRGLLDMMANPEMFSRYQRLQMSNAMSQPQPVSQTPSGGNPLMGALGGAMGMIGLGGELGLLGGAKKAMVG